VDATTLQNLTKFHYSDQVVSKAELDPRQKTIVTMMKIDTVFAMACVALVALSNQGCHAFYLPGVNPQSFEEGDP
jgi:hypothetical protein